MLRRLLVPLTVLALVTLPIVYAVKTNQREADRSATAALVNASLRSYAEADLIQTGTVVAQSTAAPDPVRPPPPVSNPTPADAADRVAQDSQVDESALRYFASQGDIKRMEAEIARLMRLHPDWVPPRSVDELLSRSDNQTQYLWDLLSEGNYAAVRAEIAKQQENDPRWQPPVSLVNALDMAEARQRIANAATSGQWRTVLSMAQFYPDLLVCAEISTLWNVGEAYARTDQQDRALDLYTYILTNCDDAAERFSTLQKASAVLPADQVATLLELERLGPGGKGEFQSVRENLLRDRIGTATESDTLDATAADLERLAGLATTEQNASDATVLGFYYYSRGDYEEAIRWFADALEWDGGAKAAEGYVLALAATGDMMPAAEIARQWKDASETNAKAYVDVLINLLTREPPPRLEAAAVADFATFVSKIRSAEAGQALGFYALNTDQTETGRKWFEAALGWNPEEDRAAFGLAIVYQRTKNAEALADLIAEWAPKSEIIAEFAASKPDVLSAAQSGGGGGSGSSLPPGPVNCARPGPEPRSLAPGAAAAFAWCLMELDRPLAAVPYFERAITVGDPKTASDASYGKSLAYLRKGMTSDAAVASTAASQTPPRAAELQTAIITQRALAAYERGQYAQTLALLDQRSQVAPEELDLMVIRGWCYFQLGRYESSRRMFQAVVDSGRVREGSEGLNAIEERLGVIIPGG